MVSSANIYRMVRATIGFLACAVWLTPALFAKTPEMTDLKVYPANVNLKTKFDRQSLVLQATYEDGLTRDVTAQATYSFGNKSLVRFTDYVVYPQADGATELKIKYGGRTLSVPVKVEEAKAEPPVSFTKDVIPVFTKSGCNSGSCHGASRGKDGFRLSLFGYDPDGDYYRLTKESIGRRVNLALPEDSLILEKGANRVPHTGGERYKPESELYQTVLRWLNEGGQKDSTNLAKVVNVEIQPAQAVLDGAGATQKLNVRAYYSDGTDRDVTSLAVFSSNNDVSAKVTPEGLVTGAARGEAFVMARFETFTVGSQFLVVPKGLKFTFPHVEENNYIDTLVNTKLRKLRIAPSELCDDATFIRRVYLDIVGMEPSSGEVKKFVADNDSTKRDRLVDALLDRKEFAQIWVMKWAELLKIRTADQVLQFSPKSALQYFNWLEDQIASNVPVDKMVQSLLTASGGSFENPAANFYKVESDTLKTAENVAQVFMGMRIQCSQCHNHPFDRWTMNDYYSFAAFFSQIGRKTGDDPRETVIFNRANGGVKHPVTLSSTLGS